MIVAFVIGAFAVGVLVGLAMDDVSAIRNRVDVGWQHSGADLEYADFLHAINHHHEPRHAIEAGVS